MNTATARKLAPKVERAPKKKIRTPLAVVKYVPTQRIPKIPLPILSAGIFVVALITLLIMNIAISSAQYELAALKTKSNALQAENQALTEQIGNFEAPQNLASSAVALGMVSNQSTATINVDSLTVTGVAKPASKEDAVGSLIPSPNVNGHYMVAPSIDVPVSEPVSEPVTPVEEETDPVFGSGLEASALTGEETATTSDEVVTDEEASEEFTGDMYGGTIPVPEQRVPGE